MLNSESARISGPTPVVELEFKPTKKQIQVIALPDSIFECLGGGAAGGGKLLDMATPIATPDGLIPIEDIHEGNYVYDRDGIKSLVIKEELLLNESTYKLTFDNHEEIICGANHDWVTLTYDERVKNHKRTEGYRSNRRLNRKSRGHYVGKYREERLELAIRNSERENDYLTMIEPRKRTTEEIVNSLFTKNGKVNHVIKIANKLESWTHKLPIDPYTLGAWLGDGSSSNAQITCDFNDKFIIEKIGRYYQISQYDHRTYGILGLSWALRAIGVLHNKHIPSNYLFACESARLELLQGLMDTDGYCDKEDGQCNISLSNKKLADDVLTLICSFGIKAIRTINKAKLYGVEKKDRHRIKFIAPFDVFTLSRKLIRQKKIRTGSEAFKAENHYIVKAERVDSVPMKCIGIASPTHQYLCGRTLIPTHNTDLGILLPCIRQFTEHPKFKGLVMRRTYADLEKEIVPRQHEWYGNMGAKYNETKKRWKFPTGAIIQNGHAEREQDVRQYDTAEYNTIIWDESTHFTSFQYLYLSFSRCRSSSPDLPAFVRSFTNPGNVGHSFFKSRFVDPCIPGGKIIIDKVTKVKRIYIPFLGRDNPYLLINDPLYLQRLEALPEVEKKAKLYGDWNSYEGQVFSEFRVFRLADEPENAVHVIPLSPVGYKLSELIPQFWPKILVIDWGWDAMTFAIWAAISPIGRLYIYRTWAWTKTPIKIWAKEVAELTREEEIIEDFVLCHSAGQHRGEDKTIQEQVSEAFEDKYTIRLADRDRIGGKNLIHEFLRWKELPRAKLSEVTFDINLASEILRKQGEERYFAYLELFKEKEQESNIPKLQILSHGPEGRENKELIDVIPACIPAERNPEDVEEFPGDDPYDALRMAVKSCHRFVDQSKDEFERRRKLQELYEKFEIKSSEAQTAAYLNFEKNKANENEIYNIRAKRRLGNRRFSRIA